MSSYKCIFGISNETKGIAPLTFNYTMKENHSYLTMTGPSLYWFLFVRLEEQHDSLGLPRYTKDDEVKLAKTYWEDKVTEETTFGDIYTNRTASVLTILPEYVLTKWHFGRIITIGDSAHKVSDLTKLRCAKLTPFSSTRSAAKAEILPSKVWPPWQMPFSRR